MVHKSKKSRMLTASDVAYLIKHKKLDTPIGKIMFIGKNLAQVKRVHRYIR